MAKRTNLQTTAAKQATHRKVGRGLAQIIDSNVTREPSEAGDAAARRAMIAEAAYYRAERRGFAPGFELEDWLLSENEVNIQIETQALQSTTAAGADLH